MKRILKEPLVHFLLLGAAIFIAYSLMPNGASGEPGKIVVTQGQLASMWEGFTKTRQREPHRDEWEGLIRDRVREEVYYREALALGLDKDDSVIRRRLQQKIEFVTDDLAAQAQPSDGELNAYLQAHSDKFRLEQQFTFRQVFLNPQMRGKGLASDAAKLLAQLQQAGSKTNVSGLGDPFLLDHDYNALPAGEVERMFGDIFARTLSGLSLDHWQGPVQSAYGVHFVFVSERQEGRMPALADVRDAVRREWDNSHRLEAKEKTYREMLKRYTVTIENPEAVQTTAAATRVK